jgi:nucleoside-diphosphate-sugar epimerase
MNLDTSKLRALGWKPVYSLADTYRRMMAAMEKNK